MELHALLRLHHAGLFVPSWRSVRLCRFASRIAKRGSTPQAGGLKISSDPPDASVKRAKTPGDVVQALHKLADQGELSVGSLAFAAKRCSRAGKEAGELNLRDVHILATKSGVQLSPVYFSALMRARQVLGLEEEAKATWQEMMEHAVPDEIAYRAAFHLCGKTRDLVWAKALWAELESRRSPMMCDMSQSGRERRRAVIAAYIYVNAVCRNWSEVDVLLDRMRLEGLAFDPPLLGQLLHAVKSTGDREKAKYYWNRLIAAGVTPDEMSQRQYAEAIAE